MIAERDRFQEDLCRAIQRALQRYYGDISLDKIVQAFRQVDQEIRTTRLRDLTYIPPEVSIRQLIERITGQKPSMLIVDEVHEAICRAVIESEAVKPAPNVHKLLERLLSENFVIAVVSNVVFWRSHATRRVLEKFGLAKYFSAEIYADVVKDVKPSPRMIKLAEQETGAEARFHVGDSFSEDVAMAFAYRIRAVLVDRRGQILQTSSREVLLNGMLVVVSSLDLLLEDELFKVITS